MKKNKGLRLAAGYLLAGTISLLPACSVRKQQEKSTWRQVESVRLYTDSLFSIHKRRTESERVRQWEMVRLSPPDSTGRQHVSAVVRSRDDSRNRSFSEDSLQRNIAGAARQEEDSRSDEKTEKQQAPLLAWQWAAGLVAVIAAVAGLRRTSHCQRSAIGR